MLWIYTVKSRAIVYLLYKKEVCQNVPNQNVILSLVKNLPFNLTFFIIMEETSMFKICSIGCGAMAKSGHGPAFAKYKRDYEDVCLAACCDINEEAAKTFKEQFGFEGTVLLQDAPRHCRA